MHLGLHRKARAYPVSSVSSPNISPHTLREGHHTATRGFLLANSAVINVRHASRRLGLNFKLTKFKGILELLLMRDLSANSIMKETCDSDKLDIAAFIMIFSTHIRRTVVADGSM
jgi:hypothetical protein